MRIINCVLFCCLFCFGQRIDYNNLDLKYYPYIVFYEALDDTEVDALIKAVDRGEEKTGLFLGFNSGWMNVIVDNNEDARYGFTYGVKLGYQSFLPSFFDRLSKPGILGGRIYAQYISSLSNKTIFGRDRFSTILLGGDLLLEFPMLRYLDLGVILGLGLGSMTYNAKADSELSFLLNTGIGTSFLRHHRVDFEMKILTNGYVNWFGALFMVGYNYVF
ncbi:MULTISPECIES: hypothetical protein [unclassified Helicobacter]|uniref:hypothetical protein n=1 Tax=unclassified Helicobacter TaxID=2593540 RepID=UPI000CF105C9|nr:MULTISPECIES: hypothetical protein [unclassified Helicobacter]